MKISITLITFVIWFLMVVLWNYLYPTATPFIDVIVAVLLSFIRKPIEKYIKIKII